MGSQCGADSLRVLPHSWPLGGSHTACLLLAWHPKAKPTYMGHLRREPLV